ncbi:MAG: hypothetical protein ACLU9Q_13835 [Marvinbryantia sp.]|uniref:hypothetical protein n=1 Tax=Marvinbryantia sp. TaxID=2496532 RepID=UPI00399BDBB2
MRRDHWRWLEKHLSDVNAVFEIDLLLDTPEERKHAEACIDIYDTKDAFNDAFEGLYQKGKCFFKIQNDEGYAAYIAGKYVRFLELNYDEM